MKKLLIAILFALMVIPAKAQSVKEEITFNGIYSVVLNQYGDANTPPESRNSVQIIQIFSNNSLKYDGKIYEPYYSKKIRSLRYGVPNGWDCWRRDGASNGHIETYVLINEVRNSMQVLYFYNYGLGENIVGFVYGKGPSPSPGYAPTPSPSPNYNSTTPSQGRTCAGCHGTGVCTMCQGKGGYYTNSGTYTGSGSKTWHQCSSCHGSGKCGVCYGKGVIR
ncbi:MAG: hypothetical protein IKJ52_06860 [Muribaculaceae bacterium]|nr:hypothetical protein [Muribaculaceae bacterium]